MAIIQEVVASLNLDKKCLSLFPWKEGGEPETSTSFSQLFFKAVLDLSDMEGYLLHFCICAFVSYRDQGKPELQMPEASFYRVFSSITLTLLLESLWKLPASTDPHIVLEHW